MPFFSWGSRTSALVYQKRTSVLRIFYGKMHSWGLWKTNFLSIQEFLLVIRRRILSVNECPTFICRRNFFWYFLAVCVPNKRTFYGRNLLQRILLGDYKNSLLKKFYLLLYHHHLYPRKYLRLSLNLVFLRIYNCFSIENRSGVGKNILIFSQ